MTPLRWAAKKGDLEIVQLLLDKGADLRSSNIGQECDVLYLACQKNHLDVAKLLLHSGAVIHPPSEDSLSALSYALRYKNRKMVRLLLDYQSDVDYLYDDSIFSKGGSPLIRAIYNSSIHEFTSPDDLERRLGELFEILLDQGSTVYNVSDPWGNTIFWYALERQDKHILPLLLQHDLNFFFKDDWSFECFFPSATMKEQMLITRHIVKLQLEGIPIYPSTEKHIKSNKKLVNHQNSCMLEVDLLKSEMIGDSTVYFYDLFSSKDSNRLAAYARNKDILQVFKSDKVEKKFPIYAETLRYQLKKGFWRKLLLDKVRGFFHAVSRAKGNENLPKLPFVCINEIFDKLKNCDLKKLAGICDPAFEMEICDLS